MNKLIARSKKLADTDATNALQSNARRLIEIGKKNGTYTASELVDFKKSMNDLYGKSKAVNEVIHDINTPILNELQLVGEQVPSFGQSFFPAEEGWKALNTVGKAQKFLENLPPKVLDSPLYLGLYELYQGNLGTAAGAGLLKGTVKKGAEIYDFIDRSSIAKNLYKKMMTNIANDATEPAIKQFNQLNKIYQKEIDKDSNDEPSGNWEVILPS